MKTISIYFVKRTALCLSLVILSGIIIFLAHYSKWPNSPKTALIIVFLAVLTYAIYLFIHDLTPGMTTLQVWLCSFGLFILIMASIIISAIIF
jgi:hypothetical protein